jgi:16S rRNA (adenine1518-N6/adenine1519-N6)-dimethyltransferase
MKPKKELGQNFLRDTAMAERLISASEPEITDNYLEIGPGEGVVTKLLAPKVSKVVAVELDPELIPNLKVISDSINNIDVVSGDILEFVVKNSKLSAENFNKVIGSIPYQITSPLLHSLAKPATASSFASATLLMQKEVAKKISSKAPSASYLSNFVQTYFTVTYVETVPKEYFYPIPKVDGAIVKLEVRSKSKEVSTEPEIWSQFLHEAFKFPRKMLRSAFDEKILKEAGISPTRRPQEISLKAWARLHKTYEQ